MITQLQDLQAQLRELNIRLADVKKNERAAYLAAVQEHVALYGIPEDELLRAAGFRKSRKRRAPAKYQGLFTFSLVQHPVIRLNK
ncbi:H-NS family nucleoid-associated regulatory protein [Burkholderia ubonensis]|uniref:H-NS family nucleoid-associated regulatory protein n=1 Tax=Burkholderia ubonensis TaxID=101571 RepID=UPI000AF3650F|nr:H-NS family nucleoid-associated regulatory protein [Burkholderia ubonensis]